MGPKIRLHPIHTHIRTLLNVEKRILWFTVSGITYLTTLLNDDTFTV